MSIGTQIQKRGHTWLAGMLLAMLAVAFAFQIQPQVAPNGDLMTPLMMARDCMEGRGCYFQINPFGDTTAIGVQHGALFNHAMTTLLWLGFEVSSFQILSVALILLAVLVVFITGRALLGQVGGQAAALIYLVMLWKVWPADVSMIWNPNLLPLPAALYGTAASLYVRDRKLRFLVVATLACGIAIQAHAAAVVGIIGILYLLATTEVGLRVQRTVIAMASLWACLQLGSPAMWIDTHLQNSPAAWIGAGTTLLGAALLWRLARPGSRTANSVPLFWAVTAVPFIPFLSFVLPEPRYVQFLVPGLVIMGAHAIQPLRGGRLRRGVAIGLTVATALLLVSMVPRLASESSRERELNLDDTAALASHFHHDGRTYADVFRHLRGGVRFWPLLNGLAYDMPIPAFGPTTHETDLAVLEIATTPQVASPDWSLVSTESGGLLVQEYTPFLRWDRFAHCAVDTTHPEPCSWRGLTYRLASWTHPLDRELVATRSNPTLPSMTSWPNCPVSSLTRIPILIPPHSGSRLIYARAVDGSTDNCPGRVVAVEGVEHAGPLPGKGVLLRGGDEPRAGIITIAWSFCGCIPGGDRLLPPPVSELRPSDLPWLATLFPESDLLQLHDAAPAWSWHPAGERLEGEAAGISAGALREILAAAPTKIPADEPAHQKQKEPLGPFWYVLLMTALTALVLLASLWIVIRGSFALRPQPN